MKTLFKKNSSNNSLPCGTYLKLDLDIFRVMNELWTISTVDMTYTRSHNHTNTVVGEHGIETSKVIVIVLFVIVVIVV